VVGVEPPVVGVEPPVVGVEPPVVGVEPPVVGVEPPVAGTGLVGFGVPSIAALRSANGMLRFFDTCNAATN
jgi:hypothetical protein